MISRSHPRHPAPRGFTLIELLLTVALVLVLLGAVIYNFSSAASGARLNEGAGQVEALFRFARAHAESTGKQVRILFPESEGGDSAETVAAEAPASTMRVTWEADPVGAPGVFRDLPAAASYVQSIGDTVYGDLPLEEVAQFHNRILNYPNEAPYPKVSEAGLSADYVYRNR